MEFLVDYNWEGYVMFELSTSFNLRNGVRMAFVCGTTVQNLDSCILDLDGYYALHARFACVVNGNYTSSAKTN